MRYGFPMQRMRSFGIRALVLTLAVASSACNEEGVITVRRLRFVGVEAVDQDRLRNALATRENTKVPLIGWELPWGRKYYFDRSRFDADLKRIGAYYADRGYPDARVTAFDVDLDDEQRSVEIAITITEGEPVVVADVTLVGFDVLPGDRIGELKQRLPLKTGAPRDRQNVIAAHEFALNELRDRGYPYARVNTDESSAGDKSVLLMFTAEPGPLAHFGPIEIQGNRTVSDNVIRRRLGYEPGDLYRRSLVQDTQRNLYSMQLFQFVNIETMNPERQDPEVRTRVTVVEGDHQRVNFGVGYGTEEKARVEGEYRHVNFLGGARSAGAEARWSSLDRGVRVNFTQPYFFERHLSAGLQGQHWYTTTPAYDSRVAGGHLTITHRTSPVRTWGMTAGIERLSSEVSPEALLDETIRNDLIALGLDPITGKQDGTLAIIGLDFLHSTVDNVLNARRGYQIALQTESAGRLLPGTFHYYSVSVEGRHFLPFGDDVTLASRAQIGDVNPAGDDETNVPFSKKFFLGGSTTIRGWGRYEVSPLSAGLPIGGNSMMAFSSELRARLKGSLGGVLFLDGGNVWADDWSIDLGDLRYAVGAGLRYQTPVGPLRFDYGYQLNPLPGLLIEGEEQTRRWRLHFSIGQAF
jgi:outer membrane protein assembly complex protein YaeT